MTKKAFILLIVFGGIFYLNCLTTFAAGGGRDVFIKEAALVKAASLAIALMPSNEAYETSAEALRTQAEGVAGESPSSVGNNGNMQNTANDLTGEGERDTATYATENRLWAGGPGLDFE